LVVRQQILCLGTRATEAVWFQHRIQSPALNTLVFETPDSLFLYDFFRTFQPIESTFASGPRLACFPFIFETPSVCQLHLQIVSFSCDSIVLTNGGTEAQEPAGCTTRSRLQLGCTLSAIRSGTRYAKWAGGSRSQTHRRAAMGGFTQDDGYVRGVAPTHNCSSRSFSNC
jgi:hypothetical protein